MRHSQKGKLAVTRVSNFLIVLCANEVVEYGMLRRKVDTTLFVVFNSSATSNINALNVLTFLCYSYSY